MIDIVIGIDGGGADDMTAMALLVSGKVTSVTQVPVLSVMRLDALIISDGWTVGQGAADRARERKATSAAARQRRGDRSNAL